MSLSFRYVTAIAFVDFSSSVPKTECPMPKTLRGAGSAKTLWLFREQLTQQGLVKALFNDFDLQLEEKGFKAQKGQIIDASFISAPIQHNSREENDEIKAGNIPKSFEENPNVKRQKDCDARWTKKNDEKHYGYKDHIAIDNAHKLIRDYKVTSAEVHDSQVFFELLSDNSSRMSGRTAPIAVKSMKSCWKLTTIAAMCTQKASVTSRSMIVRKRPIASDQKYVLASNMFLVRWRTNRAVCLFV